MSGGVFLFSPGVGTQTSVPSAGSDTTILAANGRRKGAIFYNDSTAVLYLLFSNAVSSTSNYSVQVPAGGTFTIGNGDYNGIVKGIWASANGNVRVTEFA